MGWRFFARFLSASSSARSSSRVRRCCCFAFYHACGVVVRTGVGFLGFSSPAYTKRSKMSPEDKTEELNDVINQMKKGILSQLVAGDGVVYLPEADEWHAKAKDAYDTLVHIADLLLITDETNVSELLETRETVRETMKNTYEAGKAYTTALELVIPKLLASDTVDTSIKYTWNRHEPVGEFTIKTLKEHEDRFENADWPLKIDGEYVYDLLRDIKELEETHNKYIAKNNQGGK